MKRLVVSILVVSLLAVPIIVSAHEDDVTVENEMMVNILLSAFPDLITEDLIRDLRANGYGYGEIVIICIIASQSNTGVTDVINYAEANNLGWGEVAKYFGVKLSKVGLVINPQDRGDSAGIMYLLRERYRLSNAEVYRLRLQGLKLSDILVCYELYSRLDPENKNPELLQNIIRAREGKKEWHRIIEQVSNAGQTTQIKEENKLKRQEKTQQQTQQQIQQQTQQQTQQQSQQSHSEQHGPGGGKR